MAHCDGKIDLVSQPDKLTGKGKHNAHLREKLVRMIYYGEGIMNLQIGINLSL